MPSFGKHPSWSLRRMRRRRDSWSIKLAVRATVPYALELPRCKAADVDVELVESRVVTVAGELDLELRMILRDGLAAHCAYCTDPWTAPSTVGSSIW
jgi:hypothetical protein